MRRQGQQSTVISNPLSGKRKEQPSKTKIMIVAASILLLIVFMGWFLLSPSGDLLIAEKGTRAAHDTTKPQKEVLVLGTKHGKLKIVLRPDLSGPSSREYLLNLVEKNCDKCEFYRAEKEGIFQGIIKKKDSPVKVDLGPCPPGAEKPASCFPHDPNCACHGPVMTNGMVGWAGGGPGPDFFINTHPNPAKHWMTTHTVWGELQDDESFRVVQKIFTLPTKSGGMTMLKERIPFTVEWIRE